MENEELLPKPQTDLPKPLTDLPLPEKEIPAHTGASKTNIFKSKFFLGFVAFSILIAFLIGGFYLGRNSVFKELNPSNPAIPPKDPVVYETTPTLDPTADWETYENTENGYSIKYPREYFIRLNCKGEEFILSKRDEGDNRDIIDMPTCARDGMFEVEIITNSKLEGPLEDENINVQKEMVALSDGTKAEKYIATKKPDAIGPYPEYETNYYVIRGDNKYLIHFGGKDLLDVYDQILSTFKFTN